MTTRPTITTRTMDYIKAHPGASLAAICEAVCPRQQNRVEKVVATLWMQGKVKVADNIVHIVA